MHLQRVVRTYVLTSRAHHRRTESPYHFQSFNYFIGNLHPEFFCFGAVRTYVHDAVVTSASNQPLLTSRNFFLLRRWYVHPHRTNHRCLHPEIFFLRREYVSNHRCLRTRARTPVHQPTAAYIQKFFCFGGGTYVAPTAAYAAVVTCPPAPRFVSHHSPQLTSRSELLARVVCLCLCLCVIHIAPVTCVYV